MNGLKIKIINLDTIRTWIQKYGACLSRRVFTEKSLDNSIVRWSYLTAYDAFKWFFERKEMAAMQALVRSGSTVLDIGANVGWTVRGFASAVGSGGKVLAFEPDPVALSLGKTHTRKLENVVWFPYALGAKEGEIDFFQNLSNRADNRLYLDPAMMPHTKRIVTPIKILSRIAEQQPMLFKDVSFIKIDVQGAEAGVFQGMDQWLRSLNVKPIIAIEWWPHGLTKAGSSPQNVVDHVKSLGYEVPDNCLNSMNKINELDFYETVILKPNNKIPLNDLPGIGVRKI